MVIVDGCSIDAGSRIMHNVCMGYGSVVAAEAIVNKDVHPHPVVAGMPTEVISSVEDMAENWLTDTLEYDTALLENNLRL